MNRTEGSAPQLARKGEFHTRSVFHMRFSAYFTREAHFTLFDASAGIKKTAAEATVFMF
jgi:hypothetical protein